MSGLFVKLDTGFWEHPKVLAAGEKAAVLYLQMLCYSKANLTDGYVPEAMLARFGLRQVEARVTALAAAELIDWAEGGYRIAGWDERNRSRAEVDQIREKRRQAGAKGGRPRKQPETNLLSEGKANGNQGAFTPSNPEYREQSSEFRENPPPSSDSRAAQPGPAAEADDQALTVELLRLAGYTAPAPNPGEVRTVARALANGWPAAELQAMAVRASQALVDPRAYLAQCLARAMNEPPPDGAPAEPRPLLHDQRPPCPNPDCVDGWVGGIGDDGRPVDPERCPDCTGVRA